MNLCHAVMLRYTYRAHYFMKNIFQDAGGSHVTINDEAEEFICGVCGTPGDSDTASTSFSSSGRFELGRLLECISCGIFVHNFCRCGTGCKISNFVLFCLLIWQCSHDSLERCLTIGIFYMYL